MIAENIIRSFKKNGYKIRTGEYEINLFGVRNTVAIDGFSDLIGILYYDGQKFVCDAYTGSTNPRYFLKDNPINKLSGLTMSPGQYINIFKIGYHKLDYEIMRQIAPIKYANEEHHGFNLLSKNKVQILKPFSNIYYADEYDIKKYPNKYVIGSQVINDKSGSIKIKNLLKKSAETYNSIFDYTLFLDTEL